MQVWKRWVMAVRGQLAMVMAVRGHILALRGGEVGEWLWVTGGCAMEKSSPSRDRKGPQDVKGCPAHAVTPVLEPANNWHVLGVLEFCVKWLLLKKKQLKKPNHMGSESVVGLWTSVRIQTHSFPTGWVSGAQRVSCGLEKGVSGLHPVKRMALLLPASQGQHMSADVLSPRRTLPVLLTQKTPPAREETQGSPHPLGWGWPPICLSTSLWPMGTFLWCVEPLCLAGPVGDAPGTPGS